MFENKLFKRFVKERNLKESTANGYESALKHYLKFHKKSIDELMQEAITDEENKIPLKDRNVKKRLLNYRSYLLKSNCSPNTVRTYFTKVKTFYIHFDIEIPHLPDAKYNKLYETNYLDLPTYEHIRKACDNVL
ncbi:phage integrase SAM-like domain-containing protein [Methanobrevibacter sp.]|uniref:phage integrase SAM-like domain-containing protein n=1 Tax=Methanobrevibacter sp. TaxID=66852 RepID=UPI0025FBD661|nr:phage integrase SAM-like domain-containing protein [Methanobrevibacter sp.]MBQ2832581.1 phage integrase SAM-like domain-containing protein [Methanobrevibacter sp.]